MKYSVATLYSERQWQPVNRRHCVQVTTNEREEPDRPREAWLSWPRRLSHQCDVVEPSARRLPFPSPWTWQSRTLATFNQQHNQLQSSVHISFISPPHQNQCIKQYHRQNVEHAVLISSACRDSALVRRGLLLGMAYGLLYVVTGWITATGVFKCYSQNVYRTINPCKSEKWH